MVAVAKASAIARPACAAPSTASVAPPLSIAERVVSVPMGHAAVLARLLQTRRLRTTAVERPVPETTLAQARRSEDVRNSKAFPLPQSAGPQKGDERLTFTPYQPRLPLQDCSN